MADPAQRLLEAAMPGLTSPASVDGVVRLFRDQRLELVSLLHVGGDGWPKTLDFAPHDERHLRQILAAGERADGSSLFPDAGIPPGASDVLLRPRLERTFVDPFSDTPTLVVLCGHAGRDGRPLPQSPDTIVRAAFERLRAQTGIELHALGEVEYFVGRHPQEADVYGRDERGYHASAPFVFGQELRRRALALLARMGVPAKYAHAEVGFVRPSDPRGLVWEQHEIELALTPLPEAADAVLLTHWVLRNLGAREGVVVSFEPVVAAGHAGSGLHIHLSPVVAGEHRGGRDAAGQLRKEARWLIGGLLRHGDALMALGNRAETSFTRLRQGKETPAAFTWGEFDRKALVRLPAIATGPDGTPVTPPTVEFRLPDGSAHPHLLLAGMAQAIVAGARRPDDELLVQGSTPVPRTPRDVAKALARDRAMLEAGGVFPAGMIDALVTSLEAGGGD